MKCRYYLQSGITADSLPGGYDEFYVVEHIESTFVPNRYFYPGNDIQQTLDSLCIRLYDVFQDAVFPSRDDFYKNYEMQPQWISRAGLDSDFNMKKEELEKCFSTLIDERMAEYGIKNEAMLLI